MENFEDERLQHEVQKWEDEIAARELAEMDTMARSGKQTRRGMRNC